MVRNVALPLVLVALAACKDKPAGPPKPVAEAARPAPAPAPAPALAPAPAADESDENLDRAPTADEIDRCAKLYILAAACGWAFDHEFGWIKSTHMTRLGDNVARRACTVDKLANDDGPQLPMPRYTADQLARLDAAARGGCAAFRAELAKYGTVHEQR